MLARSAEGAGRDLRRARVGRSMPPQASVVALCRADITTCPHRGLRSPSLPCSGPAPLFAHAPLTPYQYHRRKYFFFLMLFISHFTSSFKRGIFFENDTHFIKIIILLYLLLQSYVVSSQDFLAPSISMYRKGKR